MSEKIGFVGVGRMGANMARRLKDCGYEISAVYDVFPESAAKLAAEIGAKHCAALPEVTALADIIFTVVTDEAAMLEIFGGEDSLLVGAAGKLFVNCATISPATHILVEQAAHRAGAQTMEACMASSIPQARQGTLYLMVGGSKENVARIETILTKLSSSMRHVGGTGEAAKVKALVNMVMNINTAGLAEGLGLGDALGLDLTMLREVFSETGANSNVLRTDGEDMQNRDFACFFSAEHAAKDSRIAYELAVTSGLTLPLARVTKEQFEKMVQIGLGGLDKSGIAELTFKGRHET
ncbi:MAG: NAD(P)-dependent oxidoreductase [Opitutaceae bacterium]